MAKVTKINFLNNNKLSVFSNNDGKGKIKAGDRLALYPQGLEPTTLSDSHFVNIDRDDYTYADLFCLWRLKQKEIPRVIEEETLNESLYDSLFDCGDNLQIAGSLTKTGNTWSIDTEH